MPALSLQFNFALGTGTVTATSVAIPSTSISPDANTLFKSRKEKGDGYFGSSGGMHTVTYTVMPNFQGTLTIQATLATDPVESDWFEVENSKVEYKDSVNPVTTGTTAFCNFTGNFVWVRAVAHRDDVVAMYNSSDYGSVQQINYNH